MAATLEELQDLLDDLNVQAPAQLPAAPAIGVFGVTPDDYVAGLPNGFDEMTNKAQICLSLLTRAAVTNAGLATVVDVGATRKLLDLDGTANVTPAQEAATVAGVLLNSLKALRVATNPDKSVLTTRSDIVINHTALTAGYSRWIARTREADIIVTVRAVVGAFPDTAPIETHLAAQRLLGRGFTTLGLICTLVDKIRSTAGKVALARLTATYASELRVVIALQRRIRDNNNLYHYGFYTGIPEELGSKRYEHLGAIAHRALNLRTMREYRGGLKNVTFPRNVEQVIAELEGAAEEITVPPHNEGWLNVLTGTVTKVRQQMPGQ